MSNRLKAVLSVTLLFVVLFVASLSIFQQHSHCCDNSFCLQCELIKNVNDGIFILLILILCSYVLHFIASKLIYIITQYKSRVLSPTQLMVKLID